MNANEELLDLFPELKDRQQQGSPDEELRQLFPEANIPQKQEPPSQLESLLRGAADAVTFSFADEGAGLVGGVLEGLGTDEGFGGAYRRVRDDVRAQQDAALKANPGSYLTGAVGGGAVQTLATGGLGLGLQAGARAPQAVNMGRNSLNVARIGNTAKNAGRVAQTVNRLNKSNVARGAAVGGGYGAVTGAGMAEDVGSIPGEMIKGAATGVGLGAGFAKAGDIGRQYIKGKRVQGAIKRGEIKGDEQFFDEAGRLYDQTDAMPYAIAREDFNAFQNKTGAALDEMGFSPKNYPTLNSALETIRDLPLHNFTNRHAKIARTALKPALESGNAQERLMAQRVKTGLDEFLGSTNASRAISGNPAEATAKRKIADKLYSQGKKMQEVDWARENAGIRASSTGSGGNYENALMQEIAKLLRPQLDPKKPGRGWSQSEIAGMRDVLGDDLVDSLLRSGSKMAPSSGGLSSMFGTGMLAGTRNPLMAGVPVIGEGLKQARINNVNRKVDMLKAIIGTGGKVNTDTKNYDRIIRALIRGTPSVVLPYNREPAEVTVRP